MQVVVYNFESTPVAGVDAQGFGCVDNESEDVQYGIQRGWLEEREAPESLDGLNESARNAFEKLQEAQQNEPVKATRGDNNVQRPADQPLDASESDQDSAQASGDNKEEG